MPPKTHPTDTANAQPAGSSAKARSTVEYVLSIELTKPAIVPGPRPPATRRVFEVRACPPRPEIGC